MSEESDLTLEQLMELEKLMEGYKTPDNETKDQRKKKLDAKRKAKERFLKKTRQLSVSGPSSSTRSQTKKRLPISARTRETNRLRQKRKRASLTPVQKEEIKKKKREESKRKYDQKKEKEFEQFYRIEHCSLDDHEDEDIEEEDCRDGRHRLDRMNIICGYC